MAKFEFDVGRFATEHPIISFLIIDKVITMGGNSIDKLISSSKRKTGNEKTINTEVFEKWCYETNNRLKTLEITVASHSANISVLNSSMDRFDELIKQLTNTNDEAENND